MILVKRENTLSVKTEFYPISHIESLFSDYFNINREFLFIHKMLLIN
jgi:hypothetical protein